MSTLFKKLNLTTQTDVVILNAPSSFEAEVKRLTGVTVHRSIPRGGKMTFVMAFVIAQKELDASSAKIAAGAVGDAIVWMVYPKKSSKRYRCEFNRDSGWSVLGDAGFEGVRMVAVDEDWSALRFRRVEYVKSLTRDPSWAISPAGKARERKAR